MKRKRLYIFIILLMALVIFSIAAICNQCAIAPSDTTGKVGAEDTATQTIIETAADTAETIAAPTLGSKLLYKNTKYGFSFSLPDSWEGYSIITGKWEGNPIGSDTITEQGPIISIRNPDWTQENPYQDIPIMVFTLSQWDLLQQEKFHIGAAPIGPTELGRNAEYVLALPARYNFSFPTGYEEVEKILEGNPLETF
jgi:hypothetical protein